ncbi:MAG: hypothetical protein GX039_06215 [Clostridia bacterium]|nr:hypothetical protein [Clostridia bacterium]
MWSRLLKEVQPVKGEQLVPLRVLPAPEPASDKDEAAVKMSAAEEAAALLARSRKEAERIKQEALKARQQAIEEGRAAGEARGYQEGLERGRQEAEALRQEATALREEARQVLEQAQHVYRETIAAAETDIMELALTVARKIIGQEVSQRPEVIVEITRQAILQVTGGQTYVIYAGPEEADVLRQRQEELLAEAAPGARLQVIADPGLKGGGCRVETENGFIDASIDTQLEAVKKILRDGTSQ